MAEERRRPVGSRYHVRQREAAEVERRIAAEMRDDLLAIVSHDLRNPLSAIATAATLPGGLCTVARRS